MADKKNKKKKEEVKEEKDDLFSEMDDVIGKKQLPEAAKTPAPADKKPSKPSHKKLTPELLETEDEEVTGETISVNHVAEKFDVWLPLKIDGQWCSYKIDEIEPDLFIQWVHERLPGMKKSKPLQPEQCDTAQKRLDIFEEVIDLLTRIFYAARKNRDKNPWD
jgi:hypothetical protein